MTSIPSPIPQSVVTIAKQRLEKGDVAGAWESLANAGDRYADNAAGVLGANRDAADKFFSQLVKNHWENTVGENAYNTKFGDVARDHLANYLAQLAKGQYPTTQDIINSYQAALEKNGLSASAAFDGENGKRGQIYLTSLR